MIDKERFLARLRETGIDPGGELVVGKVTHAACSCKPAKKGRDGNAWYLLYADDPATLTWGCWNTGCPNAEGGRLTAKSEKTLTQAERETIKARIETERKAREEERQRVEQATREKAARLWECGCDVSADHPYIAKKGLTHVGARQVGDMLVIPMSETGTGEPASLQRIFPDGSKRFLAGTGAIPGPLFHVIRGTGGPLYVCEGWATGCSVHAATGASVAVAFSSGRLPAVAGALRSRFPDREIVIAGDRGNGSEKAIIAAQRVGGKVILPAMPEGVEGTDFDDLRQSAGLEEVTRQLEGAKEPMSEPDPADGNAPEKPSRIRVVGVMEFMKLEFPPRENILAPWLPTQGLAMVYAPRGVGKTHFSLAVSYAVASGGTFLGWSAPAPRSALFLDGEMPAGVLQERIARLAVSNDREPVAPFQIITPDMQQLGMIDLSRTEDQRALKPSLEGVDLIVVDNLSTLCRQGKEAEGESWLPVQEWALQQRAAGRSVLFIHHAGKNGEQRGTSRREDVLDTVIALKRPGDYTPDRGACFEVHFEKARGIYGDDTKPFEAQLTTTPDGRQTWTMKSLEESTAEKVAKLLNEGVPQVEIAEILGINKGSVSKAKKRAQEAGLLVVHIP